MSSDPVPPSADQREQLAYLIGKYSPKYIVEAACLEIADKLILAGFARSSAPSRAQLVSVILPLLYEAVGAVEAMPTELGAWRADADRIADAVLRLTSPSPAEEPAP